MAAHRARIFDLTGSLQPGRAGVRAAIVHRERDQLARFPEELTSVLAPFRQHRQYRSDDRRASRAAAVWGTPG